MQAGLRSILSQGYSLLYFVWGDRFPLKVQPFRFTCVWGVAPKTLDWSGLGRTGLGRTGLDWVGLGESRLYRTGLYWNGMDWTELGWARLFLCTSQGITSILFFSVG
jgi:hypothetical protein